MQRRKKTSRNKGKRRLNFFFSQKQSNVLHMLSMCATCLTFPAVKKVPAVSNGHPAPFWISPLSIAFRNGTDGLVNCYVIIFYHCLHDSHCHLANEKRANRFHHTSNYISPHLNFSKCHTFGLMVSASVLIDCA